MVKADNIKSATPPGLEGGRMPLLSPARRISSRFRYGVIESIVPAGLWMGFLLLLVLSACGGAKEAEMTLQDVYNPEVSKNFKIEEIEGSPNTLITVFNPWQGAENVSSRLLISRDGEVPSGFQGQVLKGQPERIVCMSSTHIAMLDALEAIDKVAGVSGKQYVSNLKVRESDVPDVGYEGYIDYETLLAANPDLLLLFSINGESTMEPKLRELGIPYLYIGDYVEEDPLGKAEWVVPVAEVLGKREEGVKKFSEISQKYINLRDSLKNLNPARPKVMVNTPFMDSWFMPSTESYIAQMIRDAGGDYIYKKNTGSSSMPVDIEEAFKLVSETDYWINTGAFKTMDELKLSLPKFKDADCVKDGKVYNNNLISSPGGGNDCYESGVMNPHLVLRDMIKIFHPELIEEEFTYYRQLR